MTVLILRHSKASPPIFDMGDLALYYFELKGRAMASLAPEIAFTSRPRAPRDDFAKIIRNPIIVAIAYYLGAQAAFLVGTLSDKIFAPFWPPNVILFCALLITAPRRWWILILATLPAHAAAELGVGMPIPQLLVAFATNCSVALINALAVLRLLVEPPWFGSHSKGHHLRHCHCLPQSVALRFRWRVRSNSGWRLTRTFRCVLGALVCIECSWQSRACSHRDDLA